ncbi:MAG: M4 family metallopeptidase [Rhodanobacteraceae bacterium]|nr:M4 family metallopeptidase [Rhodanobacteraceae bacterium]
MRFDLVPLALVAAVAASSAQAQSVESRAAQLGFSHVSVGSSGRVDMLSGRPNLRAATSEGVVNLFKGELGNTVGLQTDGAVSVFDTNVTADGRRYYRAQQTYRGIPVWGDGLTVQTDASGNVEAIFGSAIPVANLSIDKPRPAAELFPAAVLAALAIEGHTMGARLSGKFFRYTREPSLAVYAADGHTPVLAWDADVSYDNGGRIFHSRLFVDARNGSLLNSYTYVREALNRAIHNLNGTCITNSGGNLPGQLVLSEGGNSSDSVVNQAYRNVGRVYWFFRDAFNRDSFNGSGARITVSVRGQFPTPQGGCSGDNAIWSGSQIVMGRGGSTFKDMNTEPDVMYHELGHAVTQSTSNLVYQKESGGLNEATSDIYAASVEAWMNTVSGEPGAGTAVNYVPDADTWNLGENMRADGSSAPLRYMHDPKADGRSLDHYTQYTQQYGNCSPSQQNDMCGVHLSSGIANLAFYLLTVGGTHPRNASSVSVPKIPFDRAIKYVYEAHTSVLQANDGFSRMRNAMMARARVNGSVGPCDEISVAKAWDAVGVSGSAPSNPNACGGGGGGGNQSPVASFTATPSGLTVALNGSGSSDPDGTISSYTWNFGDGTTGSGASTTKTYSSAGTYTVTLTVTDNQGATNTATRQVTVGGGGGSCAGASYSGTFSGGFGQTQYQPNGNYYQANSGAHTICFSGPAGTDFDIFLDRWNGSAWANVAKSDGPSSSEQISYNGAAGYYTIRVINYQGTGAYTLNLRKP